MKCLVTGAAGFIGSNLIKRLSSEGYDVCGLYHNNTPIFESDNIEYIRADIQNIESLKSVFIGIDIVFHCASIVRDYGRWKKFYNVNVKGTKNLVEFSKKSDVKRFIYIGHLDYEPIHNIGYYSKSKKIAEEFLIKQYKENGFPCIIIKPGNVFGPGRAVWVLFPIKAIRNNRIALIDNGEGIFLHTYIDNLVDGLIKTIVSKNAIGKIIEITDGDNDTTWGDYLNTLSNWINNSNIKKNFSKENLLFLAKFFHFLNLIFGIKPFLSTTAVYIFSNNRKISINKAKNILGYSPKINYDTGIKCVKNWLRDEGYIK
jgi:nucleoside-diphosphate-sugar epimerase